MKKCPQCGREYDNTMAFCLDDGAELLYGPASRGSRTEEPNEPATAILTPLDSAPAPTAILSGSRPQASTRSIAVLPFAHLSSDPDNEYFCDGLAEELLNALSRIDGLKVAARTSAFSFKGKNANISEIGSALNVNSVLEGSVRKSGNRMRIMSQLVNAADGYQIWSERYDREMKDIFDIQDEITLAVVDALKLKLFDDEKAAVLKHHTRDPEALELYLRGRSYFTKFTPEYFQKAIKCFDQAIAVDPHYASAYAALAECFSEMSFFGSQGDGCPRQKQRSGKHWNLMARLGTLTIRSRSLRCITTGTTPAPSMISNVRSHSIRAALIFICGTAGTWD